MSTKAEYIPGTCNIGPKEIKARRTSAFFFGILTIALIVLLLATHASRIYRLTLFIPLSSFAIGLQQWYFKFCVNFGMRGVFNFGDMGKTFTVEQKEDYKKDRTKAWKMIIAGIVFGIVLAIVFYFLPI